MTKQVEVIYTNQNYLVEFVLAVSYCVCKERLYSEFFVSPERAIFSGCFWDVEMLLVV